MDLFSKRRNIESVAILKSEFCSEANLWPVGKKNYWWKCADELFTDVVWCDRSLNYRCTISSSYSTVLYHSMLTWNNKKSDYERFRHTISFTKAIRTWSCNQFQVRDDTTPCQIVQCVLTLCWSNHYPHTTVATPDTKLNTSINATSTLDISHFRAAEQTSKGNTNQTTSRGLCATINFISSIPKLSTSSCSTPPWAVQKSRRQHHRDPSPPPTVAGCWRWAAWPRIRPRSSLG